jgi:putative DNA primase/helicase
MPIIKLDVLPQVDTTNLILEFQRTIINYGFELKNLGQEAKINRCYSTASGKRKQDAGWYIYYITDAGIVARYGDWVAGGTVAFDRLASGYQDQDLKQYRKLVIDQEAQNRIEIEAIASKQAYDIISTCVVRDQHPYLTSKKLNGMVDILVSSDMVIIPLINASNQITSIQYIFPSGEKRYLKGGKVKGSFSLIGLKFDDLNSVKEIGIAEGYATALTINKYTHTPIVMAHSCSKIKEVCEILLQYPNIEQITIYGDNDHKTDGNPGISAAKEAQKLSQKIIIMYPENLQGTDFNDLFAEFGEKELKNQLGIQNVEKIFKRIGEIKNTPVNYLVENILQKNTVAAIYGVRGHGKTHVAL